MAHQLKRLRVRHYIIMDSLLSGMTQRQIARDMGMSAYGISQIVNSPVFQHALARRREEQNARLDQAEVVRRLDARETLDEAAVKAAQEQVELLKSPHEHIRQRSAMDILDRVGCPKVSRQDGRKVEATILLDQKQLERLREATRECFGHEPSCLMDPEPEDD